jgi:hypothetical protein
MRRALLSVLPLAAFSLAACAQILGDDFHLATTTGGPGGGGGSDGGPCITCKEAAVKANTTGLDPATVNICAGTDKDLYDAVTTCVCAVHCGQECATPCQQGTPPDLPCQMCGDANCSTEYDACVGTP